MENTESHQIIEEFMLAANEAVADTLAEADLPFLRRVHQAPDPRRLKALTDFVNELGFRPKAWKAASRCSICWPKSAESPSSMP